MSYSPTCPVHGTFRTINPDWARNYRLAHRDCKSENETAQQPGRDEKQLQG